MWTCEGRQCFWIRQGHCPYHFTAAAIVGSRRVLVNSGVRGGWAEELLTMNYWLLEVEESIFSRDTAPERLLHVSVSSKWVPWICGVS